MSNGDGKDVWVCKVVKDGIGHDNMNISINI